MKFTIQTSSQYGIGCDRKNLKTWYLQISGKYKCLHSLVAFLEPCTFVCVAVIDH